MPLLFSYGTLQREDVQLAQLGRTLSGRADALLGYEIVASVVRDPDFVAESGQAVHASLRYTGREDSRVPGMALEVTEAELAAADRYEARADYRRMGVILASGVAAWVYAAASQ